MYLWMLAAVVAYFIKGLCGFANTLVFTAILSFGSVNANISPIDLLLGYPANVILTWKNRKNLDPKVLSREYSKKRVPSSRLVLAIIGVAAGVLCGLFGVGALLAAYVNRVTDEDSSFKANISAVFIVDNTFRIILYSALGLLTFDTVLSVLKLIPFALLGLFLGIKCSNHMDGKNVKKITSVLLVLSGISLILKNL